MEGLFTEGQADERKQRGAMRPRKQQMPEAVTTSRTGRLMVEGPGQQKAGSAGPGRGLRPPMGRPGPFHLLLVSPLSRKFRNPRDRGASVRLPCRCPQPHGRGGQKTKGRGTQVRSISQSPTRLVLTPPIRLILAPPTLVWPPPTPGLLAASLTQPKTRTYLRGPNIKGSITIACVSSVEDRPAGFIQQSLPA